MFEQKRFAGRHLLTFESQKLNYFGKKWGRQRLCDSNAQLTTYGTVASPNGRSGE
jgi:hypothetical protein